jgi:hypothetical protein
VDAEEYSLKILAPVDLYPWNMCGGALVELESPNQTSITSPDYHTYFLRHTSFINLLDQATLNRLMWSSIYLCNDTFVLWDER